MLERGLGKVNGVHLTKADFGNNEHWCDICAKVKCKNRHHKRRPVPDAGWPDHPNMIHATDTMGRESITSLWGERYCTVVKDHHDGRTWTYAHRHKDDISEVLEEHEHDALVDARLSKSYREYGGTVDFPVKAYRNDNAGEFVGEAEQQRRRESRVATQPTVPNYGHGQQNAVAERGIALVRNISNAIIHSDMHNIPPKYAKRLWPYADKHAANLLLLRPSRSNTGSASPAEMRYAEGKGGRNPDWISRVIHIWGCRVVVVDPGGKRQLSGRDLFYVGVPDNFAPGILCWNLSAPKKRPRVFNSYSFQEDAKLDRWRASDGRGPAQLAGDSDAEDGEGAEASGSEADGITVVHNTDLPKLSSIGVHNEAGAAARPDGNKRSEPLKGGAKHPVTPRIKHVGKDGGHMLLWTNPDKGGEESSSAGSGSDSEDDCTDSSMNSTKASNRNRKNLFEDAETLNTDSDGVALLSSGGGASTPHEGKAPSSGGELISSPASQSDDGWGGRWFIGKPKKHGKAKKRVYKTMRAIHGELVRRGMQGVSYSDFAGHNDNADPRLRPKDRAEDGRPGFLWIPTSMGDQREDAPWRRAGRKRSADSEPVGAAIADDANDEEKAASVASEGEHNAAASAAFQRRRHHDFNLVREDCRRQGWFRSLARASRAVSPPHCGTEELLQRGSTMLETARDYGRKSVHVKGPKQKSLFNRGQALFKMANAVVQLAVANLTKGLEGVRARDVPEPKSYAEALASDYSSFWRDSIGVELANIEEHDVWEWVDLPRGRRCIDTTWAFRVKTNADGIVDKLKSRLCGRGFKQLFGIDFTESFAPVTVLASWRACLAEAAHYKWNIDIWDVKGAYLNSPLKEVIYCQPPKGMSTKGHEGQVLLLKKALYGLKQAGRAWNQKLTAWLVEHEFVTSSADPCLFIKTREVDGETQHIRLCVYVDDVNAFYSDESWYKEFKSEVMDADGGGFRLSASDDDNVFLGTSIERLEDGAIKIHQSRYVRELINRFLKNDGGTARVPHFSTIKLSKEMSPKTAEEVKKMAALPYRSMIGALNHLANYTRPDIACAVNVCAQFCANPGKQHYKAALQIIKYLSGTVEYGIIYGRKRTAHIPYAPLCAYSDSSWADDPDDRTSRSGTMLWSWGGPIEWRSSKQTAQALSTTEAEYMAVCGAVKSVVWARRLFADFGYSDLSIYDPNEVKTEAEIEGAHPVTVYEDNTGAIVWSHNAGVDHQRTKHIDLKWHYVRAQHKAGAIKLVYCPTDDMVADLLTKYLAAERFELLRDMMVAVE